MSTLEQLVALRATMYTTINNLEMGMLAETKKANEFDFYKNDKQYDKEAMEEQYSRSMENIKNIKKIISDEKDKLNLLEKEIASVNGLLNQHGTKSCLMGITPHAWQVLARHLSGNFQHRKCTVCNTEEKVGYA